MEKFNNALKEISKTYNSIKKIDEKTKELQHMYLDIMNRIERYEKRKSVKNDIVRLEQKKKDLQIRLEILKSNAKITLYDETMPVVLEILAKYKNKPYGPKTKEKIRDEIAKKTNCGFYISSQMYHIYPLGFVGNTYNIECGPKYIDGKQKNILIDNKIQVLELIDIKKYNSGEYVDDIQKRVNELKALYKKAYEKQQELDSICKSFNKLAVESMKHLYIYEYIYPNMQI